MSTSETYEFGSSTNEQIIKEAYERAGILGDFQNGQKVVSALRSLNFILISWINKRLNLFTIKQGMISLIPGQSSYLLQKNVIDILKGSLRNSVRNLGGTASSSPGGTAINAFDGNPNTSCLQTGPDGNISYSWNNVNRTISMVGITSFVDNYYTLKAQFSYDGVTWDNNNVLILPRTFFKQNILEWFSIPVPVSASYFRIVETGGSTLNISELYFNSNVNDTPLNRATWSEYHNYPDKNQIGTPVSFFLDRQIQPILNIYQTPNNLYNNFFYTFKRQIQDIGDMVDTAEIPTRFLDALSAELALRIAIKEKKLDILEILKDESIEAFKAACFEDEENVPVKIHPQASRKWGAR